MGRGGSREGSPDHTCDLTSGVVSVPVKVISSELDRVSIKDIIKEGGRPRDVEKVV